MKKISTAKIKSQAANKKVTIGMDLGDRSSRYCLLDEEGVVIGEGSTPTTKAGIAKVFGAMARCRIALETGGHSPWVSRQLEAFGHEVIVANPRNVRLIGESTRKDDRLDARTLARLARIDPILLILGPFGSDCDLRRWGLKMSERGGKNAKKRAIVAVARKLAVLLHKLWVSGEAYDPLRNSRQLAAHAA